MRKILSGLVVAYLFGLTLNAQSPLDMTPGPMKMFPHMIDGVQWDGTNFQSLVWVRNTTAGAIHCWINQDSTRLFTRFDVNVADIATGGFFVFRSSDRQSITSGLIIVSCTGPVDAQLTYRYMDQEATLISSTTVFPAARVHSASVAIERDLGRYGIIIVAVTDTPFTVRFTGSDGRFSQATLTRTSYDYVTARLLEDWVDMTGMAQNGTVTVTSTSDAWPLMVQSLLLSGPGLQQLTALAPGQ